jgi:hypothetical protein
MQLVGLELFGVLGWIPLGRIVVFVHEKMVLYWKGFGFGMRSLGSSALLGSIGHPRL